MLIVLNNFLIVFYVYRFVLDVKLIQIDLAFWRYKKDL